MAMSDNLMSAIKSYVNPEFIQKASNLLGEPTDKSSAGLMSAIPTLLTGIFSKGSTLEGAQRLLDLVHEGGYGAGVPSNYLDSLKGGEAIAQILQKGQDLLKSLFGNNVSSVVERLSDTIGLKSSSGAHLLALVAPVVMGVFGSKVKHFGLNATSLMGFLNEEKGVLAGLVPEGVLTKKEDIIRKAERLEPLREEVMQSSPSDHKKSSKKWLPFGIAAALLLGGFFMSRGKYAPEVRQVTQQGVREQAGTAVREPASIVEQVSTFLESGENSELPKRFIFDKINFYSGSLQVTPQSGQAIHGIAELMKTHPNTVIRLEGFTDDVGSPDANEKLSLARAESLKSALVDQGIDASRMSTLGRGNSSPVAANTTEEGREANRRIELVILQK